MRKKKIETKPAWKLQGKGKYQYNVCRLSMRPGVHQNQVDIMNEIGQENITDFVMQLVKDQAIFEQMVSEHDRLLREIQKMFRAGQIIMNVPEEDLDGENPLAALEDMDL